MKIISLYETASSDGYTHTGDGVYYLDENIAEQDANNRHGGYAVKPIKHDAVELETGRYLLLKSPKPISVVESKKVIGNIAKNALKKLSLVEKIALGLEQS